MYLIVTVLHPSHPCLIRISCCMAYRPKNRQQYSRLCNKQNRGRVKFLTRFLRQHGVADREAIAVAGVMRCRNRMVRCWLLLAGACGSFWRRLRFDLTHRHWSAHRFAMELNLAHLGSYLLRPRLRPRCKVGSSVVPFRTGNVRSLRDPTFWKMNLRTHHQTSTRVRLRDCKSIPTFQSPWMIVTVTHHDERKLQLAGEVDGTLGHATTRTLRTVGCDREILLQLIFISSRIAAGPP